MIRSNRCRYLDPNTQSIYYCGLDLGQIRDYTAFSVVERIPGPEGMYHVRYLKRFKLGTDYPTIVESVAQLLSSKQISPNLLLVDRTGVGVAISDLLREKNLNYVGIMITNGGSVNCDGTAAYVPKRDLVSTLQILFQSKRLKIANNLPDSQVLVKELMDFQVKITIAGNDTYGAWREGTHDDYVLSTAMACWAAERQLKPHGYKWPRGYNKMNNRIHVRTTLVTRDGIVF